MEHIAIDNFGCIWNSKTIRVGKQLGPRPNFKPVIESILIFLHDADAAGTWRLGIEHLERRPSETTTPPSSEKRDSSAPTVSYHSLKVLK